MLLLRTVVVFIRFVILVLDEIHRSQRVAFAPAETHIEFRLSSFEEAFKILAALLPTFAIEDFLAIVFKRFDLFLFGLAIKQDVYSDSTVHLLFFLFFLFDVHNDLESGHKLSDGRVEELLLEVFVEELLFIQSLNGLVNFVMILCRKPSPRPVLSVWLFFHWLPFLFYFLFCFFDQVVLFFFGFIFCSLINSLITVLLRGFCLSLSSSCRTCVRLVV